MASKDIKKRNVLTLSEKRKVLLSLESGLDNKEIMDKFKISKSALFSLKQKTAKIKAATSSGKHNMHRKNFKMPKEVEFDKCLYEWFSQNRSAGMAISGPLLIARAKILKEEMNIKTDMKFSQGWLESFKKRHGIRQLCVSGETLSADSIEAKKFCSNFENLMEEHDLTLDMIYNADETGLYWKCLPLKTLATAGEKSAAGFKQNKERITILTCSNASGQHRLKLLVIGKSKSPRALKGMVNLPVDYKSQKNAWMSKMLFKDWFFKEFVPAVRKNKAELGKADSKCILLLDNCTAHPEETELVSDCGLIFACYFPPKVTSLIQPQDQGIIRNLKCLYRNEFMLQMINSNSEPVTFQRQFTIKDAIKCVSIAWDSVKTRTLIAGWQTLSPIKIKQLLGKPIQSEASNSQLEITELETLSATVNRAPSIFNLNKLDDHDLEEWAEKDVAETQSASSSNSETIECIAHIEVSEENSTQSECDDKISWAEAEKSMETFLTFMEQTPCFNTEDNKIGYELKKRFITHKISTQKIAEIRKDFKNSIELVHRQK